MDSFYILFFRTSHARTMMARPTLERLGLGQGQPKMLNYLKKNGSSSQKDIAQYLEVDPAAISRMTENLARGGFITQHVSPESKRTNSVEITEKGLEVLEKWTRRIEEIDDIMLKGFSQEERRSFMDFLARGYENLKEGEE